MGQGKGEEAVVCYTKAIELDGANPVYRSNRAAAFIKMSQFENALADCDGVLALGGLTKDQKVKAMYRKGLAYAGLAKHHEACTVLREAEMLDAESPMIKQALESSEKMVKAALEKEAVKPEGKKKKIQIEEVDSSPAAAEPVAAEKKKAKKKIQIEEVSQDADSAASAAPSKSESPATSPKADGSRPIPALLKNKLAKSAPRTGYEFEGGLDGCKSSAARAEYMGLVQPKTAPKLLKQNLTSEIMLQLVEGVDAGLEGGVDTGMKWMQVLLKVNRFDIIVDFLSDGEKSQIRSVVDKLAGQGADDDAVAKVRSAYKL